MGDMVEAGCSDQRAAIKSRAAAMARSVEEEIGVLVLVVNHTTVSAMRSTRVSATYTW